MTTKSKMSMCERHRCFLQYLAKLLHVLLVDRMLQEEEKSSAVTVRGAAHGHIPLNDIGHREA